MHGRKYSASTACCTCVICALRQLSSVLAEAISGEPQSKACHEPMDLGWRVVVRGSRASGLSRARRQEPEGRSRLRGCAFPPGRIAEFLLRTARMCHRMTWPSRQAMAAMAG